MTYETPKLQHLGTIATLTRGNSGSCLDWQGRNKGNDSSGDCEPWSPS